LKSRVLIIDDEPEIRRNLTFGLTQEGYSAVACPDGISAIHELNSAQSEGIAYDYLVTDIFMPDIDGLKILKVIKTMYPDLPVLVITGFGDDNLKFTALAEYNTGYLDKPFEISDLVTALDELAPGSTGVKPASETTGSVYRGMRESVSAYITVRITKPEQSMQIFEKLYKMDGVHSCEAVRGGGDFDIIILAQGESEAVIDALRDKISEMDGLEIASLSGVERPKLDRDVNEFIDIYSKVVKQQAPSEKGLGTTSYIIVDIDKNAIQQIFTTVFFINEVVFCDVIDDGTKLVGMITGRGIVGRTPKIIEKLSQIDGVLRVREATVIKLVED